jgi:hypothetical protein
VRVSHSRVVLHWELDGKLDADLRTSTLLGMPSVKSVYAYYLFALEYGDQLAPKAVELVDRMVILVGVRRFHGMIVADSRSLRCDNFVRMHNFIRRSTFVPFRRFWGMCGENSCNACLLFIVLWVISSRRFVGGQC